MRTQFTFALGAVLATLIQFHQCRAPAHADRLDDMENRLQRVEYLQEQTEAYRFVRAEHAIKLSDVWDQSQQVAIDGRQFKAQATLTLAEDIRTSMLHDYDPVALEAKSKEFSNQKRGISSVNKPGKHCAEKWTYPMWWTKSNKIILWRTVSHYTGENRPGLYGIKSKRKGTGSCMFALVCLIHQLVYSSTRAMAHTHADAHATREKAQKEREKVKARMAKAKALGPKAAKSVAVVRDAADQTQASETPCEITKFSMVKSSCCIDFHDLYCTSG